MDRLADCRRCLRAYAGARETRLRTSGSTPSKEPALTGDEPLNTVNNTDELEYLSRIRTRYDSLSKSQRKIADYINKHQDEILKCSITTISRKIGTSPSAVSRFCQALHYRGYSDMKFSLEKNLFSPSGKAELITLDDDILSSKKKFLKLYSSALNDTLLQLDDRRVKWAADTIMQATMVHIYASSPGSNAKIAYELLLQTGIPCNYFVDTVEAIMSATHLKKTDVALGINYSGKSTVEQEAMNIAKSRGAVLIGITGYSDSFLAKNVDIALCYSARIEDDLRYRHVARMCELAIIGQLQSAIISNNPQKLQQYLDIAKHSVEFLRK
jgi:DNA-binding MurR/RpiR family transcriptional regulator